MSADENIRLTMVPSTTNCSQTGKVAEASMNCGRNAMKKMAVLGLSTSTVMLSKKARRADFRSMTGSVAVPWILARSSETPSQIRYSAPTSLTAM